MENNQNTNNQNNLNTRNPEIKYSRLDKEIKREEKKHKLKNSKNSNKKDLKKKILAWGLGTTFVAGAVVGTTAAIIDQTSGDGAYNREIEKKYEMVDNTLTEAMEDTFYTHLDDPRITGLYFEEPMNNNVTLKVFYEGEQTGRFGTDKHDGYADFKTQRTDYDNLIKAEESNNILIYLDCLNELFSNMTFITNCEKQSTITMELPEYTSENIDIFNEIFNVDEVKTEDIVKQIGFMPYYIVLTDQYLVENPDDAQNPVATHYTYQIHGISYCETTSENSAYIKSSPKLIMEKDYDDNHIKAYNRVITFTSSTNTEGIYQELRLSGDIYKIIDQVNNPYSVGNLYFEEANLFENYYKMMDKNFKFEKPEDFDLKEYLNNDAEIIIES